MKLSLRLLGAIYAGFLLYSVLVFFDGDAGLLPMLELQKHRGKLLDNIDTLQVIHADLTEEQNALLHDEAEIELRSRTLGYRRSFEAEINLPGDAARGSTRTLGSLVRRYEAPDRSHTMPRTIAFLAGLLTFGLSFLLKRKKT